MKIGTLVGISIPLLFTTAVFGQTERFELGFDYSYIQFNPTISGVQSRAFNGGGGSIQWNLWKNLGIKGDFQGYASTNWTLTNSGPVVTPHGTIPAGTFTSNGNMFTWMFGPVVRIPFKRVVIFGETLFGGSNTNLYGDLEKSINAGGGSVPVSGTQHPFTMAVGGGLDVHLSRVVALRLGEVDYLMTRYTNPLTDTNNQNNFRYLGGIVIKWGEAQ